MNEPARDFLIGIAHQYYPAGFPVEEEKLSDPVPAHHRTPEHERFMAAWEKALSWQEWKRFMRELKTTFPGYEAGGGTQPFVSACLRGFVYRTEPLPGEERLVTRVVAAVSVMAPLYLIYVTTQIWRSSYTVYGMSEGPRDASNRLYHFTAPQLTWEPPHGVRREADRMARMVEEVLGCRPFPLHEAGVLLSDLRVSFFNGEGPPTLLDALFSDDLANLP